MTGILTDRSRISAYQRCPRYRYLRYHAGDAQKGYEPTQIGQPLADGSFVHAVAASALVGGDWRATIADQQRLYIHLATTRGIEGVEDWQEAVFRLSALCTLWVARRLPVILAEYEVVEVEQEHRWEIVPGLVDMVRCDALLRRKDDRALFLQEFKTTRAFSPSWAAQWAYNSQILANLQAMEAIKGERVEGVIIEGLLKAPYLATAWTKLDGTLSLKGHKGWDPTPIWPKMEPEAWVSGPPWTDMDRDALFNPLVAKRPTTAQLERWKRQTIGQELGIESDLRWMREQPTQIPYVMDHSFPMFDDSCRSYGRDCDFLPLCYKEEVQNDPLGSGLFVARVPHHDEES